MWPVVIALRCTVIEAHVIFLAFPIMYLDMYLIYIMTLGPERAQNKW